MNLRFAPSPTGSLHVGSIRTMLINYILAQNLDLNFILRIDDGNININQASHLSDIFFNIGLLNITPDKVELQSKYIPMAQQYAQTLLHQQLAYYCMCDEIADCACESLKYSSGRIVLKVESFKAQLLTYKDIIFGKIKNTQLYNIVLTRNDGTPLYNYLTAIADLESNITQVIRGADHIYNTWKQIVVFLALNKAQSIPQYCHIPLILDEAKQKLSKRSKNYISIVEMLKSGIGVSAIVNYLLGLNCNFSEEVFDISYAIQNFKVEKITKQNIIFMLHKLKHINKKHIASQKTLTEDIFLCALVNDVKLSRYINVLPIINRFTNVKEILDFIVAATSKHHIDLTDEEREAIQRYNGDITTIADPLVRKIVLGSRNGPSIADLLKVLNIEQINCKIFAIQ